MDNIYNLSRGIIKLRRLGLNKSEAALKESQKRSPKQQKNDQKNLNELPKLHLKNGKLYLKLIPLLILIGLLSGTMPSHKSTSYQSAMTKFISALKANNIQQIKSMLSANEQKIMPNINSANQLPAALCGQIPAAQCEQEVSQAAANSKSAVWQSYKNSQGISGKEIVLRSTPSAANSCSTARPLTITIAEIPDGSTWKVDLVRVGASALNGTCQQPHDSQSTQPPVNQGQGGQTTAPSSNPAASKSLPAQSQAPDHSQAFQNYNPQSLLHSAAGSLKF